MGRPETARRYHAAGTPPSEDDPASSVSASDPLAPCAASGIGPIDLPLRIDVRHDLRHAASTILLLLATVRDNGDETTTTYAYDGIAQCASTIVAMVDDTDDVAHVAELVDLHRVASFTVRRASLLFNGVIECDAKPATVSASTADIARLFANLIENSCRAAGPGGAVEVRVRARGKWCELQVGDSGTGFVDNLGPRGIGLSSIAGIAVRLGGSVTLGQSSLGGALVTVTLPRVVREEESAL
jgi:signal transduction histidine kinase